MARKSTSQSKTLGVTGMFLAFTLVGVTMCDSKKSNHNDSDALLAEKKKLNAIFKESFREYNVSANGEGVVDTVYAISTKNCVKLD
jgi:hypothetical protein